MALPSFVRDQTNDARVLLAMLTEFPDLPAAELTITTRLGGETLHIYVHSDPAGFEQWRQALGLDPQAAGGRRYRTFQSVEFSGRYHDVTVRLVGFLPLPADDADAA